MTVGQENLSIASLEDIVALLDRQRSLLRAALQLGVEMEGVLARGDAEALVASIERRGELIADLRALDPRVRQAAAWLAAATDAQRGHVVDMAQEVARLRDRVAEQVRAEEHAVRAARAKLALDAGALTAGGAAVGAYKARRVVAARFTDKRG